MKEGSPAFVEGHALACGVAATSHGAPLTFVTQECSFVRIMEE